MVVVNVRRRQAIKRTRIPKKIPNRKCFFVCFFLWFTLGGFLRISNFLFMLTFFSIFHPPYSSHSYTITQFILIEFLKPENEHAESQKAGWLTNDEMLLVYVWYDIIFTWGWDEKIHHLTIELNLKVSSQNDIVCIIIHILIW